MQRFLVTADPNSSAHVITPNPLRDMLLVSFACEFETNGTAGTRRLLLDLRDTEDVAVMELGEPAAAGQTDTLIRTHIWGPGDSDGTGGANRPFRLGMSGVGIPAGWDLRIHDFATISAGDRVRVIAIFETL